MTFSRTFWSESKHVWMWVFLVISCVMLVLDFSSYTRGLRVFCSLYMIPFLVGVYLVREVPLPFEKKNEMTGTVWGKYFLVACMFGSTVGVSCVLMGGWLFWQGLSVSESLWHAFFHFSFLPLSPAYYFWLRAYRTEECRRFSQPAD
jgi:hypothetical protein